MHALYFVPNITHAVAPYRDVTEIYFTRSSAQIFLIISYLQVKRPGDKNVRCTILLLLDYQPLQFKLDPRLARLLGVHTQTRPVIISALWQYIKTHKLQVRLSSKEIILKSFTQILFILSFLSNKTDLLTFLFLFLLIHSFHY